MSQYGFKNITYGGLLTEKDVSGFTFTLNPLATPGIGNPHGLGTPLDVDNGAGAGSKYAFLNHTIDPWQSYIINDSNVSAAWELEAATPIFWVLAVHEVTNPRLEAYFTSNASGTGQDIKFYLKGAGGRFDTNNNTNQSRTSDATFLNVQDPYFHTNGASPFTANKLFSQAGVGGLGSVTQVCSNVLSPYNWLTNGDGTASGSASTSPNAASQARTLARTYVTKEPTLSYREQGAFFEITAGKQDASRFDLHIQVYESGSWNEYGLLEGIVGYRSSYSYVTASGGNILSFPGNVYTGVYAGWYGDTLWNNGMLFNYAASAGFTGASAWGSNADFTSWSSAFSTTLGVTKGFPVMTENVGAFSATDEADQAWMITEDFYPEYMFGMYHEDQTCGSYWDLIFTLTSGTGKNWDTHIDDESEAGSNRRKAIFGYKDSQGAMNVTNGGDCNQQITSTLSNTTSNNQLRHVDHHEYWYGFGSYSEWGSGFSGPASGPWNGDKIPHAPNSYVYNQPTCGDQPEWETQIIEHEYIPAPILDPNLNEFYYVKVRPNNTWNVPGGVTDIEVWSNPSYALNSVHLVNQNAFTLIQHMPQHPGTSTCSNVNIAWYETKSVCALSTKNHYPTAALKIGDWHVIPTDETCSALGKIDFNFGWSTNCSNRFYDNAPDDYTITVKLHLSLNNTGVITHTIVTTTTDVDMGFDPATGNGNPSGTTYGSISGLPCGDYYTHSIEVMPMTSSMFTTGNSGDSHIWTPGNGGSTWLNLQNTNNQIACAPPGPVLACSHTNATCGSLGSFNISWAATTGPYTVDLYDGNGALATTWTGGATNITQGGQAPDTYTVVITDANGCTDTCTYTIINAGGSLTTTANGVDGSNCILSDGFINISTTGGTGPYTVQWTDGNGTALPGTGLNLNPAPPGNYSYTVTDANGCQDSGTATIGPAPTVGMACAPETYALDTSGAGNNDGVIVIGISNTTWPAYPAGPSPLYNPSITVTDQNGVIVLSDTTFNGFHNFFAAGNPSNLQVTGLAPGTYTVEVSYTPHVLNNTLSVVDITAYDACTISCPFVIADPGSGGTCTGGAITPESCTPGNDGTIEVTATGGSTTSFHHWEFTLCTDPAMTMGCQTFVGTSTFGDNTTGNTHTFTGLAAGTYYSTVTPCYGPAGTTCLAASAATAGLVVTQLGGPTFSIVPTHPTCALGCDGSFTHNTAGGTAPYLYQYWHPVNLQWQPPGGTNWGSFTTTGHCALDIQGELFRVIDANGCEAADTVTLIDPPAVDFTQAAGPPPHPTINPATCGASDGSVTFTLATGGTISPPHTNFQYDLYNSGGVIVQTLGAGNVGGVVPQWIGVLAADTYTLRATDSNGCYEEITFTVPLATFTVGINHSDQGCTFPPSNDGSLEIVVSPYANVPVPNYTYVWTNSGGVVVQNETIAGTTSTNLTGLPADTYTYTVTDGNGCSVTGTQVIALSADTQENVAVSEVAMSCPTGCGILNISNTTGDFPLYVEISDDAGATWTRVSVGANAAATAFNAIALGPPGIQVDNNNYYKENTSTRFCFSMGATYHIRTVSQLNTCPSVPVIHTMANTAYVPMLFTETLVQPTCCGCNNAACNGAITNVISNGVPIAQGVAGTLMSYDWTLTHDGIVIASQSGAAAFGGGVVTSTMGAGATNEEFDTIAFTGLYPGTYVFTATDDCGETQTETWVLIDPRIYVTDIVTSNPLCLFGCDDGTVTVTATGGDSGTYQFSMDDGITWQPVVPAAATSYTFTGVGPGTWSVWARDPSCGSQILFDPTDNVLTADNGCYSDFISGIWPAGTQTALTPVSDLNTQWVSTTNNSLPGSSDGIIEVNILGGTAPYEVSVLTSAGPVTCDGCALQTIGVIPAGLSQYIDINGAAVSNTGITTVAANGALVIDNLSVSLDFSGSALGAWYTIYVKDSTGCFSCISQYVDNGTLGIIGIYAAEDCNCSCPDGYSLITPPEAN